MRNKRLQMEIKETGNSVSQLVPGYSFFEVFNPARIFLAGKYNLKNH